MYFRKQWTGEIWTLSQKVDFQPAITGLLLLAAGKFCEMYFHSPFLFPTLKKKNSESLTPNNTFLQTSQKADINFIQKYSKPAFAEESCSSVQEFHHFFL